MASPRPGSEDRAWNDPPPTFPPSGVQNANVCSTGRRILSKRVMYGTDFISVASSPPPPSAHGPSGETGIEGMGLDNIVPRSNQTPLETVSTIEQLLQKYSDIKDEEKREESLKAIDRCFNKISSNLQKRTSEDVKKRLDVLRNSILQKSLSVDVSNKLHCLLKELDQGNHKAAHEVHLNLMMAHVGEVSQWMVGVKHIIQAHRELDSENDEMPEEETAVKEPLQEETTS